MIDTNLPLELDDGTPVTLVRTGHSGGLIVKHSSAPTRPGMSTRSSASWGRPGGPWSYDAAGRFVGGTVKDQFVLRNVVYTGPEEYEEWFK